MKQTNLLKAFTLVEMLVALAVSAIIIGATYASYEMVATQYKKNIDIADMHTSGRAIMRIIERDVRMAGFEYRDKDAKITYGSISNPITIKDSGNKCCDEVTVIYDYFDEASRKAERIRIRYWTEPHTSNKGSRHRLYKQKDILGQNKKILATPILGTKDVMADYIEDLQIGEDNNQPYIWALIRGEFQAYYPKIFKKRGYGYGDRVMKIPVSNKFFRVARFPKGAAIDSKKYKAYISGSIYDLTIDNNRSSSYTKGNIGSGVHAGIVSAEHKNGLLAVSNRGNRYIEVYDSTTIKMLWSITTNYRVSDVIFAPNGYLYASEYYSRGDLNSINIYVYDSASGKLVETINISAKYIWGYDHKMAVNNNLLYVEGGGRVVVYDLVSKQHINTINEVHLKGKIENNVFNNIRSMCVGVDNFLYITVGGQTAHVVDLDKSTKIGNAHEVHLWNQGGGSFISIECGKKAETNNTLVEINLTLRTKNQYGKDRVFKKQDYHGGNFKIDKTDKYKRDTFSTTVLVRNLAL
jgi:prepilin-type N-terminal cleavage/methylation domain-containing protein